MYRTNQYQNGRGDKVIPDVEKIKVMATLFSVSTEYLLRDEIEELDHGTDLLNDDRVNQIVTLEEAKKLKKYIRNEV